MQGADAIAAEADGVRSVSGVVNVTVLLQRLIFTTGFMIGLMRAS